VQPKEKFYKCCHERVVNSKKFPGITLHELVAVEDVFEINVMIYLFELHGDYPKAYFLQMSRKSMKERCTSICLNHTSVLMHFRLF